VARQRLGQHFLYDISILDRIIHSADLSSNDTVVEIGPGPGILTKLLAATVRKVIAIEIDKHLHEKLRVYLSDARNVELIHGDALKYPYEDIGGFKAVANIPYYITTPLIFRLLDAKASLASMTLTVQKEVAERIVARPGGKDYGVLSVSAQYYSSPSIKFIISKEAFRPIPRVDSAVVHMKILKRPPVTIKDEELFFRVVKTAFSMRRKTLANSLSGYEKDIRNILAHIGIDPRRRPETLTLEEFSRVADALYK
jgi:16S rRNA (adenine1518-N6/adenine1519-N6)-dimethyltransferase